MKKFRNNKSGVIYTVTNEKLIDQYESRKDIYTEINEVSVTLAELKAQADGLGLEYAKKVTKAELLELINNYNEQL